MSCECLQSALLLEERSGGGSAFACGHQWSGFGAVFDGIRRKLTITDTFTNGDVITTQTYDEHIVKAGEPGCEPFVEETDRDPEFDYGDYVSTSYLFEDPYETSAILAAADASIAAGLAAASWVPVVGLALTGGEALFQAGNANGFNKPGVFSYHQIATLGDPGGVSWYADGVQAALRFTLRGPRLPCRVEIDFSNGDTEVFTLNASTPVHEVTVPFNIDTDVGGGVDSTPVVVDDIRYFFTPFA